MRDPELILVAASLIRGRDAAFERGLSLARASGAQLYVLHAVPTPASRGATKRLAIRRELVERAERAGVKVQAVEQQGDPAEIIELHADARDVDLIVMGADRTPRSIWARRWSVAERMLRRTTKPTLVVPIDDTAPSGYAHALVGVDVTAASTSIVQQTRALIGSDAMRITLVHAVKRLEASGVVPGTVDPRLHVATGSAAAAIVKEAETIDADLIVVGSRRRFTLLGSTASRVLGNSKRALLVIPVLDNLPRADLTEPDRRAA